MRTCSLKCCLEHKSRTGCNGKRDRTAFCSLARFTDAQLASDFHFLEDVLKCGERAGRFVREEMGGPAGGGGGMGAGAARRGSGRGKQHGGQRNEQQHQQQNGSLRDDNAPISPLLRLSMKAGEEKDNCGDGGSGEDEKAKTESTTSTTKLDEREEGEVEEASTITMPPAAHIKGDEDTAPVAKRQKLDDYVANGTTNNSVADSSLLNICQPASSSTSKEGDDVRNQQMENPITAAAATNNSNATSKIKVAEPEWLSRHPPHLRRLVRAAADRNTTLLLMPAGMARRKENTTTHSPKQNVIRWRIELRFHLRAESSSSLPVSSGLIGDTSSNGVNSDSLPCSVITIFLDGIPESTKLSEILSAQLDVNPEGKNREARSKLRAMATMPRSSLRILTKVLPCPASRPVYTEITSESSVADALAGLTVVEYPVFEVVKEDDLDNFPRKIEELSGADRLD